MKPVNMNRLFVGEEQFKGQCVRDMHEKSLNDITNSISTSFGPLGLDKMCVDHLGEVLVTNDGATILSSMDVTDPASKMMVDLAKQQDNEVGDGTTGVVLLASSLIEKGNQVIRKGIHPSTIIGGFKMAYKESINFIKTHLQVEVGKLSSSTLKNIVETSISSKVIKNESEHFSKIVVEAIKAIEDEKINLSAINILKKQGGSMKDSALINGYMLNCNIDQHMPKKIRNPRVLCLDFSLNKVKMPLGVNIVVDKPDQLEEIRQKELNITAERIKKIISSGANLILTSGGIDDVYIKQFVEAGIMAVKRVKEEDLKVVATAVGTSLLESMCDLEGNDSVFNLGFADSVVLENIGNDDTVVIYGMKKKMASILLRGANEQLLDEMQRSVHDALSALKRAIESKSIVAGGGHVESALSLHLDNFANTICSKDQIGIHKFSEALLIIPKTLALNAGLDSNDVVAKLLINQTKNKDSNVKLGINLFTGQIQDNIKNGIIEPTISKLKAIRSATDIAIALLRVDEVIKLNEQPQ